MKKHKTDSIVKYDDLVVLHKCRFPNGTPILHLTIIYGDAKRFGIQFDDSDIDEIYRKQSSTSYELIYNKEFAKMSDTKLDTEIALLTNDLNSVYGIKSELKHDDIYATAKRLYALKQERRRRLEANQK